LFVCREKTCAAPASVENAGVSPCWENEPHIQSGGICTAECQEGYEPTVESLYCSRGDFTPASFQCREKSCVAPSGIENAEDVTSRRESRSKLVALVL